MLFYSNAFISILCSKAILDIDFFHKQTKKLQIRERSIKSLTTIEGSSKMCNLIGNDTTLRYSSIIYQAA
jgi:hypothetical protein